MTALNLNPSNSKYDPDYILVRWIEPPSLLKPSAIKGGLIAEREIIDAIDPSDGRIKKAKIVRLLYSENSLKAYSNNENERSKRNQNLDLKQVSRRPCTYNRDSSDFDDDSEDEPARKNFRPALEATSINQSKERSESDEVIQFKRRLAELEAEHQILTGSVLALSNLPEAVNELKTAVREARGTSSTDVASLKPSISNSPLPSSSGINSEALIIQSLSPTPPQSNFNNDSDEMVFLGSNFSSISKRLLTSLPSRDYRQATRRICTNIFTREELGTHTLTGKQSPAFQDIEARPALDARKVADIVEFVTRKYGIKETDVRAAIAAKCYDEKKHVRRIRMLEIAASQPGDDSSNLPDTEWFHEDQKPLMSHNLPLAGCSESYKKYFV